MDVVPRVTWPATCQKTFFACAPPLSPTCVAAAVVRSPEIWKIHTSSAPPEIVVSVGIVTLIAYFIGLVTHAPPATLPMRLVVLLVAAGVAALIRCVLLPERPRRDRKSPPAETRSGRLTLPDG